MKQLHHGSGAPAAQAPPGGRSHVFCLRPHRRAARMAAVFAAAALAAALLAGGVYGFWRNERAVPANSAAVQTPYPLQTQPPYTVALDAGHGGFDTGAQISGIDEVEVCNATVDALEAWLLQDEHYRPVRTRSPFEDLSTTGRAAAAIAARASLLLSIHANYDADSQSHGFECFPTPPGRLYFTQSMRFAECIAAAMQAAGHRLRGETGIRFAYYDGDSKKMVDSTDTAVRSQRSFGMVEKPLCPAVLAEQCFLSNSNDAGRWASAEGCRRAGRVYYEAICAYFGTQPLPQA